MVVLSLFAGLLLPGGAAAQNRKKDAVYLKSGDVVIGKIDNYDSLAGVVISNDCGIWNYRINEVDRIQKYSDDRKSKLKPRGYYNISSVALLLGEGADGFIPYPSITTVNGYQWNQQIFAGIGLGYEFYEWSNLPLFAEVKFMLEPDVVTPFFSFKTGYSFPLSKNKEMDWYGNGGKTFGGVLLSPEAGIKISLSGKSALLLGIGYHYQELSYEEPVYGWMQNYEKKVFVHYNRISLRIGFMFQ
ncbi:MAG: hypothetical protein K0B15_06310 [Lentimicrobium sp.]|nr:hypothetical protein [Lentimicrobium sp.]